MKYLFLVFLFTTSTVLGQSKKYLLIRSDDIGMSHSVNMATKTLLKTGLPFSASVMFACPWYQEAVEILKDQPHVTVGIHLTLNAEWKNYRWGPVSGAEAVPSLVDEFGHFFPSRATFNANNPSLKEIEMELRAQIERAINSGLSIRYVDYHMGTAVDKPEYVAILEKLAAEYKLAISRFFGEKDTDKMYAYPFEEKKDTLLSIVRNLEPDTYNLLVTHVGYDNPELAAMIDLNTFGPKEMSKHRNSELNALISKEFKLALETDQIELLNYGDLIDILGLDKMKRPAHLRY